MSDSPQPLISVVVPTCDRPDLLRLCLDRLAPGEQGLDAAKYEGLNRQLFEVKRMLSTLIRKVGTDRRG